MFDIELLAEDPQRLVDNQTRFKLQGPAGTFTATLEDGWAAGGPWLLFRFHDGPLQGQALWMTGWDPLFGYEYLADTTDDGFRFNPKDTDDDDRLGGAYLPDLHGVTFYPLAEG